MATSCRSVKEGRPARAAWNLARYLRSGELVEVLGDFETPPADIYAVYLERLNLSAKEKYRPGTGKSSVAVAQG